MKTNLGFMFLVGLLVLSLSVVSADTSFRGTVRDTNIYEGAPVENATVTVSCGELDKTNITDVNGVYGITFLETQCNISDNYVILAVKDNKSDITNGTVNSNQTMVYLVIKEKIIPIIENTTINGTIYYNNTESENIVNGATVTVTCNAIDVVVLTDINGTYSANFLESACNNSHIYSIFAVEGEYNGTSGNLNVADGTVADVVILKSVAEKKEEIIEKKKSGGGGWTKPDCGKSSHYEAGVGCVLNVIENKTKEKNESTVIVEKEDNKKGGFTSLITGAIIGGGVGSWVAALVFAGLVLMIFFLARKKNGKKK